MGECPTGSGNLAEYGAVSSVLRWLAQNGFRDHVIEVRSDSQLIVNQLSGKYNCHDDRLRKLRDHVREIAALFPRVTYVWIPREENRYADAMSKALQNGGTLPPVPLPNMT
jgi:ribonuclease HI